MSNATQSVAAARINSLLDANSFVEIGQAVTARATDFNMTEKKAPSDGVITPCLSILNFSSRINMPSFCINTQCEYICKYN